MIDLSPVFRAFSLPLIGPRGEYIIGMKQTSPNPIAYSLPAATRLFVPPISLKRLRSYVRNGALHSHAIGRRAYVLRDDLAALIGSLPECLPPMKKDRDHGRTK